MKPIFTLLFIGFFMPLFVSAQSNYKSGFVVTLKGDTLHGYVDYKEWEKNPVKIKFKTNLNKDAEVFSVENTSAFGISGLEYYEQYSLQISKGQVDVQKISTGVDTNKI